MHALDPGTERCGSGSLGKVMKEHFNITAQGVCSVVLTPQASFNICCADDL